MSTAKGLAFALEAPLVGIGRLEIEAYAFAAIGAPVVVVHRAGRGELAWAAYIADPDGYVIELMGGSRGQAQPFVNRC